MQFFQGARYLLRGFKLILKPRIRRFVYIPLAVNISLFSLVIFLGYRYTFELIEWLSVKLDNWISQLPNWLAWLGNLVDALQWIIWPVFIISALLFVFFFFSLIANIISAPFNGFLSEAVERLLTGQTVNSDTNIAKEVVVAISHEIRKLAYFVLRALPLLVLFLIPIINIAAPFLWLLFTAWMLAIEYLDYPMSNHHIAFKTQRHLHRQRRSLSFGFGTATALANAIPFVNFFAIPSAVAGATALYIENLDERNN